MRQQDGYTANAGSYNYVQLRRPILKGNVSILWTAVSNAGSVWKSRKPRQVYDRSIDQCWIVTCDHYSLYHVSVDRFAAVLQVY